MLSGCGASTPGEPSATPTVRDVYVDGAGQSASSMPTTVASQQTSTGASEDATSMDSQIGVTQRTETLSITVKEVKTGPVPQARIRSCVIGSRGQNDGTGLSWKPWSMLDAQRRQVPSLAGHMQSAQQPRYPGDDTVIVPVGKCVEGWIAFGDSPGATAVVYENRWGDVLTWTIG